MSFVPREYGSNFLNIDRTIEVAGKLQRAFANPGGYYTDRNNALLLLQNTARETFANKYNDGRLLHFSEAECKARAENILRR